MPDQMAEPRRVVLQQDDQAFGQRLVQMQPRVEAFLRSLGCGRADDLVQETLARAWRSRASFAAERGAFDAWLLRIGFRTFLDERRQQQRAPGVVQWMAERGDDASPADGAPPPMEQAAARERMETLLGRLEPTERDVLLRFHRDGLSVAAIARELALPVGTVKSHLHRARTRLWQRCRGEVS
jgi:RNA polymerase sigma-70 factor (ECF subfamily)